MQRFQYDNLTSDQLRIGIALLNQEGAVVDALEQAADEAVTEALAPFGLNQVGAGIGHTASGATGGARTQPTKSQQAAARPAKRATVAAAQDSGSRTGRARTRAAKGATGGVSPAQLESRKLQGAYIAAIRSVPQSRRAKYKSLVKGPGGRQAAIDAIHHDHPAKA